MTNEDTIIKRNEDFLVTETALQHTISADFILALIKKRRTNGRLTFEFVQGGIRSVILSEKTKPLTETESDQVRLVLGME